ncbi:MAG: histidine triad nucleotide-binding protein [Candidatus Riflebacteria bacterium]|nr:histidine triad nucleotide-binding protein [Candidatus Riflebacteria bacterium]
MENCIFCKIARGEIPSTIVYRDENVFAFRDISPQAPSHILVVPVKHIPDLLEDEAANGNLLEKIFKTIQKIAKSEGLQNGFRIVANHGDDGGQSVQHIHFHILGKRRMVWPPG